VHAQALGNRLYKETRTSRSGFAENRYTATRWIWLPRGAERAR
jgi:hypothetical protein